MTRPDWDTYFLGICTAVSARGDCVRKQVGAIVVKNNRITGCGYNGSAPGQPGCLTGNACPRGRGETPATGDYDLCIATHAEVNAILDTDRDRRQGATLYCTHAPCPGCAKVIASAGIIRTVSPGNGR